jgi:hypothetical protein
MPRNIAYEPAELHGPSIVERDAFGLEMLNDLVRLRRP